MIWSGDVDRYGRAILEDGTLAAMVVADDKVREEIQSGAELSHTCGRKACLKPSHLEAAPAHLVSGDKYPRIMAAVEAYGDARAAMARAPSAKRRAAIRNTQFSVEQAIRREIECLLENAFNIAVRRK